MADKFSVLTVKLCQELQSKEYDKNQVLSLLYQLNDLRYKNVVFVDAQDACKCIESCMKIKVEDKQICISVSSLMCKISTTQNLKEVVSKLDWHYMYLSECSGENVPQEILVDLYTILKDNNEECLKYGQLLLKEQLFNNLINHNLDVTLIFLKLLSYVVVHKNLVLNFNHTNSLLANLLKGWTKSQNDISYCKMVIYSLNILSKIFLRQSDIACISDLMSVCHYFVLYGLVKQDTKPERIFPAKQCVAITAPVSKKANTGKKQKLRKPINRAHSKQGGDTTQVTERIFENTHTSSSSSYYKPSNVNYLDTINLQCALTSDSDVSDKEFNTNAKLVSLQSKVRQSASNLLLTIFKNVASKVIFGYWLVFLPNYPDASKWCTDEASKHTLAYCAMYDPVSFNREAALKVILEMITKSRIYLYHAESSKKTTSSFIPFSESIAYTITCLHEVFHTILEKENSLCMILATLKCCAVLIQATPYHKLDSGLVSELLLSARKFMYYRDVRLQVGALIVIGCFLSIEPKIDEIFKVIEMDSTTVKKESNFIAINNRNFDEITDFEEGYSDDEDEEVAVKEDKNELFVRSWILDKCFMNLGWMFKGNNVVKCNPSGIKVILESLQVLSAIAFHHFDYLLKPHMNLLMDVLCDMLKYDNQEIVLQAAKTVSVIGDALAKLETSSNSPPLHQCVDFWQKTLTPLSCVLQCHENPTVKAIACDCIANIGEKSFKELPRNLQVLCCTLLVGLCNDDEENVRGAAIRALAMVIMYRTLREDICFVTDCGENILRALNGTTSILKAKAAWAIGNYSDALLLNFIDPEIEDIEDDLCLRLLNINISCAKDDDTKIKLNAPRGLGNLLRLVTEEKLNRIQELNGLTLQALKVLNECTVNMKNMKVLWNVCHAMGSAMKNDVLYTVTMDNSPGKFIQNTILPTLIQLSQNCSNLKVRINAVVALRSPKNRMHYGDTFWYVWNGLLVALQNVTLVAYDTEYRHKDNLIEQLFVTLAHLTCLLTSKDETKGILSNHEDILRSLSKELCCRLPPENQSCVKMLDAAKYLLQLPPTPDVVILKEIFSCDLDSRFVH